MGVWGIRCPCSPLIHISFTVHEYYTWNSPIIGIATLWHANTNSSIYIRLCPYIFCNFLHKQSESSIPSEGSGSPLGSNLREARTTVRLFVPGMQEHVYPPYVLWQILFTSKLSWQAAFLIMHSSISWQEALTYVNPVLHVPETSWIQHIIFIHRHDHAHLDCQCILHTNKQLYVHASIVT